MPKEGNKRYSSIPESYKIHRCQRKGGCVEVETASTRVEYEGKGFMTSVAVVRWCVGVEGMTGAMAMRKELERDKEARGMGSEGDRKWSAHMRWRRQAGVTGARGDLRGGLGETLTKCEVFVGNDVGHLTGYSMTPPLTCVSGSRIASGLTSLGSRLPRL